MRTKTIRATHGNAVFTRRTNRTYTHVVIGKRNRHDRIYNIDYVQDRAEKNIVGYLNYWTDERLNNPRPWDDKEEIANVKRLKAMPIDEVIAESRQKEKQRIEKLFATEYFEEWIVIGWCGRPDLAEKVASRGTKIYIDVFMVEVEQ